jgi:Flp pilus assembly protein TadB
MTRVIAFATLLLWSGLTLLFSELRWFRRVPLAARLRPYAPDGAQDDRQRHDAPTSFYDLLAPTATKAGGELAKLVGVSEDLSTRLTRIHSPLDSTTFRLRQLGWSVAALGVTASVAFALGLGIVLSVLLLVGAPILAFLVLEQRLSAASADWQRRLFLELPVVSEQFGMLLSAGYSMAGAIGRIADRGTGNCARDLRRVRRRIQQGLSEIDALREWAQLADVPALDQLVSVLALNREAGDLGHLISDEARAIRQEVHRETLELIERRTQQVWIPVTVATLVPGVMFLAVPFIEAMRLFADH